MLKPEFAIEFGLSCIDSAYRILDASPFYLGEMGKVPTYNTAKIFIHKIKEISSILEG